MSEQDKKSTEEKEPTELSSKESTNNEAVSVSESPAASKSTGGGAGAGAGAGGGTDGSHSAPPTPSHGQEPKKQQPSPSSNEQLQEAEPAPKEKPRESRIAISAKHDQLFNKHARQFRESGLSTGGDASQQNDRHNRGLRLNALNLELPDQSRTPHSAGGSMGGKAADFGGKGGPYGSRSQLEFALGGKGGKQQRNIVSDLSPLPTKGKNDGAEAAVMNVLQNLSHMDSGAAQGQQGQGQGQGQQGQQGQGQLDDPMGKFTFNPQASSFAPGSAGAKGAGSAGAQAGGKDASGKSGKGGSQAQGAGPGAGQAKGGAKGGNQAKGGAGAQATEDSPTKVRQDLHPGQGAPSEFSPFSLSKSPLTLDQVLNGFLKSAMKEMSENDENSGNSRPPMWITGRVPYRNILGPVSANPNWSNAQNTQGNANQIPGAGPAPNSAQFQQMSAAQQQFIIQQNAAAAAAAAQQQQPQGSAQQMQAQAGGGAGGGGYPMKQPQQPVQQQQQVYQQYQQQLYQPPHQQQGTQQQGLTKGGGKHDPNSMQGQGKGGQGQVNMQAEAQGYINPHQHGQQQFVAMQAVGPYGYPQNMQAAAAQQQMYPQNMYGGQMGGYVQPQMGAMIPQGQQGMMPMQMMGMPPQAMGGMGMGAQPGMDMGQPQAAAGMQGQMPQGMMGQNPQAMQGSMAHHKGDPNMAGQ